MGDFFQSLPLDLSSFQDKSIRGYVNIACGSRVGSSCLDNLNYIESFELISMNVTWCWLTLFEDLECGPRISWANACVFIQFHVFELNLIMGALL